MIKFVSPSTKESNSQYQIPCLFKRAKTLSNGFKVLGSNLGFLTLNLDQSLCSLDGNSVHSASGYSSPKYRPILSKQRGLLFSSSVIMGKCKLVVFTEMKVTVPCTVEYNFVPFGQSFRISAKLIFSFILLVVFMPGGDTPGTGAFVICNLRCR